MTRTRTAFVIATVALLVLAGCGSSSGSDDAGPATTTTTSTTAKGGAKTTTTAAAIDTLDILVSNDDGYRADGIDVLVEALRKVDGVKVTVVAPKEQRSGTGGSTKEGPLEVTDVTLKSGYPAKAVDGFPADTIRVAVDEMGLEPDLVITGINLGQNLGPLVDVSGTVGAARAAVARGVPALATSQGLGDPVDYRSAVPFVLDWLAEHRKALSTGDVPAAVDNLNVPSCPTGKLRGLVEVPVGVEGNALGPVDCTSTAPKDQVTTDIDAFAVGFATIDEVPAKPAA